MTQDVTVGLRHWRTVALAMAVGAETMQLLLTGRPAFLAFVPSSSWLDWINFIGSFAGVPAAVLWIGGKITNPRPVWLGLALGLGFAICGYLMGFENGQGVHSAMSVVCVSLAPLGALVLCSSIFDVMRPNTRGTESWGAIYLRISVLLGALSISTNAALSTNRIIFPATWDYFVYRIDGAFGGFGIWPAAVNSKGVPLLQTFTTTSYAILIVAFFAIVGLAIRKDAIAKLNVWRALVLPFAAAWFLYALLPLSGPHYAFFDGRFPGQMPGALEVAAAQVVIPPAYRNGMPSMHLTGALLIWLLSIGLRHRIAIFFSSLLVAATAWATLATGEHYVLDLIVALPFAAFLGTSLIWPTRLRESSSVAMPIYLSGATFLAWTVLLRVAPEWLSLNFGFVRALSAWSVLIAGTVFWGLIRMPATQLRGFDGQLPHSELAGPVRAPFWIIGVFVMSGLAGLIYEVVYAKALAVTFGSTALASYTVLATYMGGMALGAWIGGHLADRSRHPLKVYANCEALIGLYAAITPQLFVLIQWIYVELTLDTAPDAAWLSALRVGLGVICLGIPTTLMGATMPLMFKHLRSLGVSSRSAIAPLYGANVAGAAAGSIIAGYWLLPAVGRNGGTYIAAVMSLMIALYVIDRMKRSNLPESQVEQSTIDPGSVVPVGRRVGMTALCVLLVGGAITLGLEVNSMHLLAVVAGNSVYAFALMLAMFLAGLGLGSYCGERLMDRFERLDLVAWSQCGIALTIAATAQIWDDIPSYFASFSIYPVQFDFAARETIRAMVCATAMLPVALFIGMSYPAAMSLASDWLSPKGGARGLGVASGLNTLGNIGGVLLVGFWLLPTFGSNNSSLILALVALVLGALALTVRNEGSWRSFRSMRAAPWRWSPVVLAVVALLFFPKQWNYDDLSTGSNVYFAPQGWGKVIDHAESVEGGMTSVTQAPNGILTLLTNGKFQGNNATGGEMVAQESFALFPLLHTARRDTALVIGYGTGMTTRVLHEANFALIDVAETSKDIVSLADRYFENINHHVTKRDGVSLYNTDGRNFLLTQSRRFDLISIEITSIWFAGAANLYNKDFYALAKTRLNPAGVLQQWVQLHHMTPIDLTYVLGSVRSEFKYVWLYVRGGQGIIVASNDPESMLWPGEKPLADSKLGANGDRKLHELKSHLVLSPVGVDNLISSFDPSMQLLVSTDRNLYLEHSTPKGNVLRDVVQSNIQLLGSFEPKPLQLLDSKPRGSLPVGAP
ncbi:fused MFS/spermidine synthase [Variovorax saccharolyticus]|uniref:fused MFS/spermidine synthase n=1 Tax=Variovorax saccharolyticus TaxID=3053516 RepID=UPI002578F03B|nr:fused MFS/spermidine synthase [Variovorax sp. J22R187]MDM0019956.1 fused MFS/spermidine synthase [Variovorax sp. J22R187]